MPTITISKSELMKHVTRLSDLELSEILESIGIKVELMEFDEITLEVSADRPDLLSIEGISRTLSTFLGKKSLRKYKTESSRYEVIIEPSVKEVRPFTACAIVKNLHLTDERIKELVDIQEKLHITFGRNRKKVAIGIYPLEKIKFPIKYLAKKPHEIKFRPLDHPYDISAIEILQKHPKGIEYATLLEEYKKYPIFVDANKQILSMPPIINSERTGKVTAATKEVFIECSGYDFNALKQALNIIVTALSDMNAKIFTVKLRYGQKTFVTPILENQKMKLDLNYINKILGLELKEPQIRKYLEKMGLYYSNKTVIIPPYRTDILHQVDIAEEVAIAHNYSNFKEEIPRISTVSEEDKFERFKNKLAETLVGLGYLETNTYHLTSTENQTTKMNHSINLVALENPSSKEYNVLRAWLVPSLIEVLSFNKHNEYPQKIFEIGNIFLKDKEITRLAILDSHMEAGFTEIKQVLEALFQQLHLNYTLEETDHTSFIQGRVARISVKDKPIAYMGEIHPKVLVNFGLEMPLAALEINLTELFNLIN